MEKEVVVLRYGHRYVRDSRVTTHCCLVARALGAKEIIIEGSFPGLEDRIEKISEKWGGRFKVGFAESWKDAVKKLRGKGFKIVHLTMYGEPLNRFMEEIKARDKVCVIIGSQKVEPDVYLESDINISVGRQPHSEIAALTVFLDRYFGGKELERIFHNAKINAEKMKKGKIGN